MGHSHAWNNHYGIYQPNIWVFNIYLYAFFLVIWSCHIVHIFDTELQLISRVIVSALWNQCPLNSKVCNCWIPWASINYLSTLYLSAIPLFLYTTSFLSPLSHGMMCVDGWVVLFSYTFHESRKIKSLDFLQKLSPEIIIEWNEYKRWFHKCGSDHQVSTNRWL